LFVLLFTRLALQGIVCYTFLVYCRAVMSLPCVERKTQASRDCLWQLEVARVSETEGLLKTKLYRKTIPQSPSVTAPFTQGSLWFVRPESPSAFPYKHCFCGHKSEAPPRRGKNVIYLYLSKTALYSGLLRSSARLPPLALVRKSRLYLKKFSLIASP